MFVRLTISTAQTPNVRVFAVSVAGSRGVCVTYKRTAAAALYARKFSTFFVAFLQIASKRNEKFPCIEPAIMSIDYQS